ncbi:hypothetical protein Tco_1551427, partial [Tanacetum coccineum]
RGDGVCGCDGGVRRRGGIEGGGGGVELVTRMAAGVWGRDDGDGHEGGVMVAPVGRQPEEVEARSGGGMVAGGGGRREGWPEIWRRWRRERVI